MTEKSDNPPKTISDHFASLKDPRDPGKIEHRLIDVVTIAICAVICGADGFTEIADYGKAKYNWFKGFLELLGGIPSHDTFGRIFSLIRVDEFQRCFQSWIQTVATLTSGEVVAIDGKCLRRSHDRSSGKTAIHMVNAWASRNRVTIGQVKTDEKSNEITAIPQLLSILELKGCIVTIDAMGCQKEIAAQIADKKADYVLALKGNHATAHEEIIEFFADAVPYCATQPAGSAPLETMDFFQTLEKGHGRIETRRYWQSTDIDWFEDKKLWKQLRSVGMVESIRSVKGKQTIERRYYLSSLPLDAKTFAKAVRGHWGVENPLHWTLDVTFREDQSRARTRYAAQNLATLRP
jgi:predicted transposase YbfD/YdcC